MASSWGFPAPILPGKEAEARALGDYFRQHRDQVRASRDHAAVSLERAYLMTTPGGSLLVEYGETQRTFGDSLGAMLGSGLEVDNFQFSKLQEVTGIDFSQPPVGPPPQLVLSHYRPSPDRGHGLAFAAPPLGPGKAEEYLRLSAEATSRMEEFIEARLGYGITVDRSFLNRTPMGDFVVVYLEGVDPVAGNQAFSTSTHPFDVWFREQVTAILGVDFTQPLPPIELLWEWRSVDAT